MFRFLILLSVLGMVACSEKDKSQLESPRQAIQLEAPQVQLKGFSSMPETLTVFFWPTEEFFDRHREQGVIQEACYETYIADISETVIRNGDAFDGTVLSVDNKMKEGAALEDKISRLQSDIGKALNQRPVNEKQVTHYRSELKAVEARYEQHQEELGELYGEVIPVQARTLGEIQAALDPQAAVRSDDELDIDSTKQVNWFPVYSDSASDFNIIDLSNPEAPYIELGEWGPDAQSYKTWYKAEAVLKPADFKKQVVGVPPSAGRLVLVPESEIYNVSLSPEGVLKFEFMQKNSQGRLTGRRYEFELQVSEFASRLRLMGDVRLVYEDRVLRSGQFKALLVRDEYPTL